MTPIRWLIIGILILFVALVGRIWRATLGLTPVKNMVPTLIVFVVLVAIAIGLVLVLGGPSLGVLK
jgi:hypothetical protein